MSCKLLVFAGVLMVHASCRAQTPTTRPLEHAPEVTTIVHGVATARPIEPPAPAPGPAPTTPRDPYAYDPCVPVTDCRIVARHRFGSPFARRQGFFRAPNGLIASARGWSAHGRPEDTVFVEVAPSCEVPTGYYIESTGQVWLPSVGGEEYVWNAIEGPTPRRFRPLGGGFNDDGRYIYDRAEVIRDDPPVDRATFHACVVPPEDEREARFYPVAEDSHGVFGWGEHGDVSRLRR